VSQAPIQKDSLSGRPRAGYKRSDETRARVLEAALAEACEVGFQRTSLAKVAARAGVAVGVLNYHFGSKRELMRRVMVAVHRDLRDQLLFALPVGSDDFFEQERAGLLAYIRYLRANPAHSRLAEEVRQHDPELHEQGIEAWIKQFSARVQSGVKRGAIPPMNDLETRIQAHFVLGAYSIFDLLLQSRPYPGDEAVADAFLGLLRNGLGHAQESEFSSPPTQRLRPSGELEP